MRRYSLSQIILTVVVVSYSGYVGAQEFVAHLVGFNETPSVNSGADGRLKLSLDKAAGTATYELTFSGLSGLVTQSHIHFAKDRVAGGIMVFLCGTASNPGPAGTPMCPANGTVTGTISAANIIGPAGQLIAAGDFAAFVRALLSDSAYANVHSTLEPAGEIRGQVVRRHEDDE